MSASDSGYSSVGGAITGAAAAAETDTATTTSLPLSSRNSSSSHLFSVEECGEGMQEALRRRRRTLIDSSQLQSSTESGLEFTAPPSTFTFPGLMHPAESEVIELLKMAFILQATDLRSGDLPLVASSTLDLWADIKDALCDGNECVIGRCCATNSDNVESDVADAPGVQQKLSGPCIVGERFKDVLADITREGLLEPLLLQLVARNEPPPPPPPGGGGLNFLLRPTTTQISPSASALSLTRAGRCFPELSRLSADGGGDDRATDEEDEEEEEENADIDDEMKCRRTRSVTIHVCDGSRNAKRDFVCNQDLLLSQMGYFRDITSGQSLEDVDISVHCDIAIFEWLMEWINREEAARQKRLLQDDGDDDEDDFEAEDNPGDGRKKKRKKGKGSVAAKSAPFLDPSNVLSILVSASFLKMSSLVEEALKFAHDNMNKILAVTHNLNCLGEPLITRLSALYKPSEVEDLLDRRDRIHSKLYTRLIASLGDPLPQPEREIFYTLATLHRCSLCGMFLTKHLSKLIPCLPQRANIDARGDIVPRHQRDHSFNLNDFIRSLRTELKSWRRVFWRLWGMVHPLYCSLCSSYFPVYLNEFCRFHPQDPEFPTIQFKNSNEPYGQYACCEIPVLRYQPCPNQPPIRNIISGDAASSAASLAPTSSSSSSPKTPQGPDSIEKN